MLGRGNGDSDWRARGAARGNGKRRGDEHGRGSAADRGGDKRMRELTASPAADGGTPLESGRAPGSAPGRGGQAASAGPGRPRRTAPRSPGDRSTTQRCRTRAPAAKNRTRCASMSQGSPPRGAGTSAPHPKKEGPTPTAARPKAAPRERWPRSSPTPTATSGAQGPAAPPDPAEAAAAGQAAGAEWRPAPRCDAFASPRRADRTQGRGRANDRERQNAKGEPARGMPRDRGSGAAAQDAS